MLHLNWVPLDIDATTTGTAACHTVANGDVGGKIRVTQRVHFVKERLNVAWVRQIFILLEQKRLSREFSE